ncbi:hypothetical protein LINPERPRIM_LOCUS15173, partial [Linum perenne]
FPSKVIWQSIVPTKIACFCWQIFHKKVATIDNLQKRGFSLANRVWSLLSSLLSIHGPLPSNVSGFIQGSKGLNCHSSFSVIMKVLMHVVFWYIWKERNDRIFREAACTPISTFHTICCSAGDWLLTG